MDWSPVSPDMSLIENVWSVVELILHKAYKWRSLKEFKRAAKQAWDSVTSDVDFREHMFSSSLAGCRSASKEMIRL
jgi:hypothetical protein